MPVDTRRHREPQRAQYDELHRITFALPRVPVSTRLRVNHVLRQALLLRRGRGRRGRLGFRFMFPVLGLHHAATRGETDLLWLARHAGQRQAVANLLGAQRHSIDLLSWFCAHHYRNACVAAGRHRNNGSRVSLASRIHRNGAAGNGDRCVHSRIVAVFELAGVRTREIGLLLLRVITGRHRLLAIHRLRFRFGFGRYRGHRR